MTTPETTVESQVEQAPAPAIGLVDLQNAIKIIDYAAEQGAFKGWAVIEQVIAVRNKINQFVVAATPPEEVAPVAAKKVTRTPKAKKATVPVSKRATK